ncbi:hypothetical protein HNP33_003281 [Comamonas odontotermitis]|uniref:Uncharacterized protein n=1 Tax=Comamonas odontotermitis TaxID=379895 RepID=A0ABR6RJ31_9BURK|nr:hypothetical protein [Comamonas odontotermitis]MBB6579171.1 hypothetical protein [Comamonas odontotermitis]
MGQQQFKPFIELFKRTAEALDARGEPVELDTPLALLSRLMSDVEGYLSETEMLVLAEIGGYIYREGKRSKTLQRD